MGDVDRNLGSIKLKIPAFKGKIDPEAYLDWKKKVEMIFDIHRYTTRFVVERKRNRERPVNMWEELKTIMKKRYVPKHHYRELFNHLQMIT